LIAKKLKTTRVTLDESRQFYCDKTELTHMNSLAANPRRGCTPRRRPSVGWRGSSSPRGTHTPSPPRRPRGRGTTIRVAGPRHRCRPKQKTNIALKHLLSSNKNLVKFTKDLKNIVACDNRKANQWNRIELLLLAVRVLTLMPKRSVLSMQWVARSLVPNSGVRLIRRQ